LTAGFSKAYKFRAVDDVILWQFLKTAAALNERQICASYLPRHSAHVDSIADPIREQL
jgi:hypothetical protein